MEYRSVGRSGLAVSSLGLGCNNFGMRIEQADADAVVAAALEHGITLFDTADIYSGGESERMLGQALGNRRDQAIIATKLGIVKEGQAPRGGSRSHVIRACEASLRRLGTDYIDLLFLHKPDPQTPVDETLDALDCLVNQGKVRYIGCSNFSAWQLADADHLARSHRGSRFIAAQAEWSLLARDIERELVPAALHFGTGIIPYFPLASGLLTGKYRREQSLPPNSRLAVLPAFSQVMTPANFELVERLDTYAQERGHSLLELAMSWVVDRPGVASVLFGATRAEQVQQNVAASQWQLTTQDLEDLDIIIAAPAP
ncbi:aldo/keto reductase [Pusillimonas sp.]|uniref:aldo/keto reductase n=1 Tax=Pusillimonas sp. TaxID=3040095 RepID=UPI0037C7BF0E